MDDPNGKGSQDAPDAAAKSAGQGPTLSMQPTSGAFQDKTLNCKDCGQEFVWTGGEQEFYSKKGFDNPPSRCTVCRSKYKAARQQFGRVESKITCKKCGKESTVPFVPRDPNSVLCRECFAADKSR